MYTCCIFLDLKKAFETVDHYLLLQKLEITYRFRGTALDIMKSYLIDNNTPKLAISTQQNKIVTAAFRKVLRWDLCYSFYILTIYYQLHFFLRHFFRMTLFCLRLTKT